MNGRKIGLGGHQIKLFPYVYKITRWIARGEHVHPVGERDFFPEKEKFRQRFFPNLPFCTGLQSNFEVSESAFKILASGILSFFVPFRTTSFAMNRRIFNLLLAIGASLIASGIITLTAENQSLPVFVGWFVFFFSIQAPLIFIKTGKNYHCSHWFRKVKN